MRFAYETRQRIALTALWLAMFAVGALAFGVGLRFGLSFKFALMVGWAAWSLMLSFLWCLRLLDDSPVTTTHFLTSVAVGWCVLGGGVILVVAMIGRAAGWWYW